MFCARTEKFLSEKGVEFTSKNVAQDEQAFAELERIGTMTTPVTVIDGKEIAVGFDRAKMTQLLGL